MYYTGIKLKNIAPWLLVGSLFMACNSNSKQTITEKQEDLKAKEMLQGIWINDEDGSVAFRAKGDSIFYPDSVSVPVAFKIIDDSIAFIGTSTTKYAIKRQAEHLFEFTNTNNELVRLVKSDNPEDVYAFENKPAVTLNQGTLIKNDTVVSMGQDKYHSYIQINPTTYKVIKPNYNDEGVEVSNVYYDNIIHLSVFKGNNKVFSKDFYKQDFSHYVPAKFLEESILNEISLLYADTQGIHYKAVLGMPDSPLNYVIEMVLTSKGQLKMHIKND